MPIPTQSMVQFSRIFDPILGSSGGIRPPEQLLGGFDRSTATPTWSIPTNIASPLPHRPQDPYLGATSTPFLIPGFNHSIPSHAPAQPYQWNTGNQFPHIDLSLNNFDANSLFHTTEYPPSGTTVDNLPQGLLSDATGYSQSTVPPVVTSAVNVPFSGKLSGSYHSREPLGESASSGSPYLAPFIIPDQDYCHLPPTSALPSQETMSSQTEIQERALASFSQIPRTSVPSSTSSGCGQAQAIPTQDNQSIPSPAGTITNMSTFCHPALSTPQGSVPPENILQRASWLEPIIPPGLVSGGSMSQVRTPSQLNGRMPNSLVQGEFTQDHLTTKEETGRGGKDAGRDKPIQARELVPPLREFRTCRSRHTRAHSTAVFQRLMESVFQRPKPPVRIVCLLPF